MTSASAKKPTVDIKGLRHVIFRASDTLVHAGSNEPDDRWTPIVGAPELFNSIKPHQRMIYLTGNLRASSVLKKMKEVGFEVEESDFFEGQDSADAIAGAADQMNVSIDQCLVIDESVSGIRAAQQLGAGLVIKTNTGLPAHEQDLKAHWTVEDLFQVQRTSRGFALTGAKRIEFGADQGPSEPSSFNEVQL